jgi:hypothetical protein
VLRLLDRVLSPHRLEDHAVGEHAVVAAREQRQEIELLRRQPDLHVAAQHPTAAVVDADIASPEHSCLGAVLPRAPERDADSR